MERKEFLRVCRIFFFSFLLLFLAIFLFLDGRMVRNTDFEEEPQHWNKLTEKRGPALQEKLSPVEEIPPEKRSAADLILLGARQEVKNGTIYDASYEVLSYPGGDVSPDRGACTDVIIRAFRHAGIDLQKLIHEDMKENFSLYPQNWSLSAPDPSIDHRRIPNQMRFFERHGIPLTLEVEDVLEQWQWGDVVYWRFSNGRDHCGIISDLTGKDGLPLVIHNAGLTVEEDCLLRWQITGHFRFLGKQP